MSETKMGRKKLQLEEKSHSLTLLEKGESVIAGARNIGVSREAIYQLKRSAASLSPGIVPKRKSGSGAPKKTSPRTDKLLKREVLLYPSIPTVELKNILSSSKTFRPEQFDIDFKKILVYLVAVQSRSPCSLRQ